MTLAPVPAPMLVAACAAAGALRPESRRRPGPGPGEILLRLHRAGLCGTDLWKLRHGAAAAGSVLGHEVVGSVVELGAGVAGLQPGDRLFVPHHVACGHCDLCRAGSETMCSSFAAHQLAPGGFSEYLVVREPGVRAALVLPPELADEAAVFLEPAACVLRGFRRSGLGPLGAALGFGPGGQILGSSAAGTTRNAAASCTTHDAGAGGTTPGAGAGGRGGCAAILGAGSMGLLHLLVGKALFPTLRFVVSEPLAPRRELALRLGADGAAMPGEPSRRAVEQLSDGQGAGVVFDTAGGAAALAAALALTRPGGTVVLFAHAAAGECAGVDLNQLFKSERRLVATYSSAAPEQTEVLQLLAAGRLDPSPLVSHRLPLSRCGEAVELAASRRALKVLLHPDPASGSVSTPGQVSVPDSASTLDSAPAPGPASVPGPASASTSVSTPGQVSAPGSVSAAGPASAPGSVSTLGSAPAPGTASVPGSASALDSVPAAGPASAPDPGQDPFSAPSAGRTGTP
jgi:L-iditol 2-dehydrogenase